MTWTLRLYDSENLEIAWVTADPYDVEITHPDGSGAWRGLEINIWSLQDARERVGGNPEIDNADGRLYSSRFVYHGETPKEHLEWVEKNIQYEPGVESTVLTDE